MRGGNVLRLLMVLLCCFCVGGCGMTCCAPHELARMDCRESLPYASFFCEESGGPENWQLSYRRAAGVPLDLSQHAERRSRRLCGGGHYTWLAVHEDTGSGITGKPELTKLDIALWCMEYGG